MRKLTSLILASTLAFGAASAVHAAADNLTQPPAGSEKPTHKPPMHHGMNMMFKGLNLTDVQKKEIHDILKESHKDFKRPSLEERRAGHAIIASDTFDRAKVEARAVARMEKQNKLYNVLTPEQKEQYNANYREASDRERLARRQDGAAAGWRIIALS
ncbi:Spheroplast protein Y precursor|nr:Spheroplast protein Y precursor [Candidatus Pantoea persica]